MLASLVTLTAPLALAPRAQATEKAIWGPLELPDGRSAIPTYADLGVDVLQVQLVWSRIAPAPPADATDPDDPAYRWPSGLDAAIAAAEGRGIEVALMARATPAWATGDAGAGRAAATRAPDDPGSYADFVTAASRRYPSVRRWMIWGEPNGVAQWTSGPVAYAELLDAAYATLENENPENVVVGGMTFSYGDTATPDWIAALRLPDGKRPRLDEYGHNPFTRRCPDLAQSPIGPGRRDISDLDTLIDEVRAAFGVGTRLWLSEFTVSSDRPSAALDFFVSREQQANWLTRAFAIAGSLDYVSGIGWFNLHDREEADGLTTGLTTYAGEPKPAYEAFRVAELDGSDPLVPCLGAAPAGNEDPDGGSTARPPDGPSGLAPAPAGPAEGRQAPKVPLRAWLRAPRTTTLRALTGHGYRLRLRCDRACSVGARLVVERAGAAPDERRRRIASPRARASLEPYRVGALTLRLDRRAAARLRGQIAVTLVVVARDSHGDARRARRPLTLL